MTDTPALFTGHAPQSSDSDERYTPRWIFDGLALTFDLDPASPGEGAGDCVPATRKLTKVDNGLAIAWSGMVWLNPPFSAGASWADKFREHGNGVFLGPIANSRWALQLMAAADFVWLCSDFASTHAGKRSSMPLFMAAMGDVAAAGLHRLATTTNHRGVLYGRPWWHSCGGAA